MSKTSQSRSDGVSTSPARQSAGAGAAAGAAAPDAAHRPSRRGSRKVAHGWMVTSSPVDLTVVSPP